MKLHNVTKLMIINYFICSIWLFGWYVVGISAFSLLTTTKGTSKASTSQTSMNTPLNGLIFDNYEPYYSSSQTTGIQKGQFVVVLSSSSPSKRSYEDTATTNDDKEDSSNTSRQPAFSIQNLPLWKRAMETQREMSSPISRTTKAGDHQQQKGEEHSNSLKLSMPLATLLRMGLPYVLSWSDSFFNFFPMSLDIFKTTNSKTHSRLPISLYERYSSSIRLRYRTKLSTRTNDL